MSSRDVILKQLRSNLPEATSLPVVEGDWIQFEDPVAQFQNVLESVGGQFSLVSSLDEADKLLRHEPLFHNAPVRVSTVPGVGDSTIDWQSITDQHELSNVDFAVIAGEYSVAENGAIWVPGQLMQHRVLPFITQYLAIVIYQNQLVPHLHAAYALIPPPHREFGVFISGPSKTADIEQSLVIGAHGSRSMHVIMIRS